MKKTRHNYETNLLVNVQVELFFLLVYIQIKENKLVPVILAHINREDFLLD